MFFHAEARNVAGKQRKETDLFDKAGKLICTMQALRIIPINAV
jgi:hypothetical protein